MSENLVRALLGGTRSPSVRDATPPSRLGAYLDRAYSALAGARGLAKSESVVGSAARAGSELARAARELCCGVRIAHGLSPTRERDLRVLLYGSPSRGIDGLAGLWAKKLEPLCGLADGVVDRKDTAGWIAMLQTLIDEARTLPTRPRRGRDARARR